MKRWFILPVTCFVMACGQNAESDTQSLSKTAPAIALTGRVVDTANLLSSKAEAELSRKLLILEETTGPQFVVVTTECLDGQEIETYSLNLANAWGIGNADRDDGVVLLVAPNERKVRIEVGYGLEASLSDPFCSKVIQEEILPHFREKDMERGIIKGADRLIEKMNRSPAINVNDNQMKEKIAA